MLQVIFRRLWKELDLSPPSMDTWPEAKKVFQEIFETFTTMDKLILKAKELSAESISAASLRIIEVYLFFKVGIIFGVALKRALFAS